MTTLTTEPVASLLDRLFQQADAATSPAIAEISPQERIRMLQSKTEYLDLYGRLKALWLPVSPETGKLLYMLARLSRAKSIVEFGTSFGISTVHLASALRDNGGGRLITSEFEPSKIERAREHITAAGLIDLVEIRAGDALDTLSTDLPEIVDFLLLDGAKGLYGDILDRVESRLRPGAIVVADNVDMSPEYAARVRSPAGNYMSLSFDKDVELSIKLT
ncbi:O-methyltransferase [Amorphus sp. 3PC139-8]|uniref:O-methyltransferase n=1 Tax=Amorphus sp. 3PC139-8 TaxID=2735676 RepID=UPI00345CA88B